ncbi:MAG: hypothetical protein ACPGVB_16230 [Chitinophagales bacterium]
MKVARLIVLLTMFFAVLSLQSCTDEPEGGVFDCPIGYTGIDCENFDDTQVQVLLDAGITPLELLNGNIPLSSLYGKRYAGGLIFYVNANDGSGMVAAEEDQSKGARWGCQGEINGADGEVLGTGVQNTMEILAGCTTSGIAAKICDDLELNGYMDWFLPSKGELNLIWTNLADFDGDGHISGVSIGEFEGAFYSSSTEFSDQKTWVQFFGGGLQIDDYKGNFHNVRAVRAF